MYFITIFQSALVIIIINVGPAYITKKLYPKPVLAVLVEFRLVTDGRTDIGPWLVPR